ncbi:tetratricopeptide repeat-containing protein, partial [Cardiosporidium cionae]
MGHSNSFVELPEGGFTASSFPSIKELLYRESSPLRLWHSVAHRFQSVGLLSHYEDLLDEADTVASSDLYGNVDSTSKSQREAFSSFTEGEGDYRIPLRMARGATHILRALQSCPERQHSQSFEFSTAENFFKKAEACCLGEPSLDGTFSRDFFSLTTSQVEEKDPSCSIWSGRGFLSLVYTHLAKDSHRRGEYISAAFSLFQNILWKDSQNFVGHLGIAEVHHLRGRWALALKAYAKALFYYHLIPLGVRTPLPSSGYPVNVSLRYLMGVCLIHLKEHEKAVLLFHRCLALTPHHVPSLCALFIILPSEMDTDVRTRINFLERAYQADPQSPLVLLLLTQHLFLAGDFEGVEQHLHRISLERYGGVGGSLSSLSWSDGKDVENVLALPRLHLMADLKYQYARCFHFKKKYLEAYPCYKQALEMQPLHSSTLLNLAKCALFLGRPMEAKSYLITVLKLFPNDYDSLKLLAFVDLMLAIKPNGGTEMAAREGKLPIIRTQTNKSKNEEGEIFSQTSSIESLLHVGRRVDRLKSTETLDKHLYTIQIRAYEALILAGRIDLTEKCLLLYEELTAGMKKREKFSEIFINEDFSVSSHPLLNEERPFELMVEQNNNFGVFCLMTRKLMEARRIFDDLLQKIKKLLEGNLSLKEVRRYKSSLVTIKYNSSIHYEYNGDYSTASHIHKELTMEYSDYVDGWLKRAQFAMESEDFNAAFSHCTNALRCHTLSQKESSIKLQLDAFHNFKMALRMPHRANAYAANALSIILAEHSMTLPAWDCFRWLMESSNSSSSFRYYIHRNMAILLGAIAFTEKPNIKPGNNVQKVDQQKISKAYHYYSVAMKCRPMDREIHLLMARFLYDCMRFKEAIELLQVAQILWPNDIQITFNLNVCMDAHLVNELKPESSIENPQAFQELYHMSQFVAASLVGLIKLKETWNKEKSTSHSSETYHEDRLGLEAIPDVHQLQDILNRYKKIYIPNIKKSLPVVEKNWMEALELKNQMKLQQQQMREEKEVSERQKEEKRLLAEKWQQERANQLMNEANETAAFFRSRYEEAAVQERIKTKSARDSQDMEAFSSDSDA